MALAHTILALLAKHPESGYDISKHFDEGLSCYWKATPATGIPGAWQNDESSLGDF